MEWIKIVWNHEYDDQPYEIYMELDAARYDVRKLEFFKSDKVGYVYNDTEVNGTGHNIEKFPTVEDYNKECSTYEFETLYAEYISKYEFESKWKTFAVNKGNG